MRYHVLACDYDGTIAHHGKVDAATLAALTAVKNTGRRLVLVTGRELDDLSRTGPSVHGLGMGKSPPSFQTVTRSTNEAPIT